MSIIKFLDTWLEFSLATILLCGVAVWISAPVLLYKFAPLGVAIFSAVLMWFPIIGAGIHVYRKR